MTQPPQAGSSAPTNTGQPWTAGHPGAGTPWSGAGAEAPSPSHPTSATPWGSTSTSGGDAGYAGPGPREERGAAPASTSTPFSPTPADATTANVPLVQGTKAPPTAGSTRPPSNARHSEDAPSGRGQRNRSRGPRRARLQLRHIDPWTVLKFACVLSIALFFVWLIVVGVLYGVLDGAGAIDKINEAITSINANGGQPPIRAGIVFGGAAIIGVVNMVLFIALSTIGSVVYNLCADLVGGIEVTLSER